MLEGRLDRALRDLVEHDPVRLGLRHAQLLGQVPPDRFAFTIGVRCDEQGIGSLRGLLQVVQHLLLGRQDSVVRLEALLLVHAQLALGQVADVAHGRLDDIFRVEILLNRLDLGGRLDDDQGLFRHALAFHPRLTCTKRLPSSWRIRPSSSSATSSADARPELIPLRSMIPSISAGSSVMSWRIFLSSSTWLLTSTGPLTSTCPSAC